MLLTPQVIVPTLLVPLIGYRLYRRFRAHFGRQTVHQTRMVVRLVVLALVGALFMMIASRSMPALEAAGGGLLAGIALGVLGTRLTRFEADAQGRYYTPNAYIGGIVMLLLITRLVYRMFSLYSTPQFVPQPGADPLATLTQSPLTLTFVMLTVGYYLTYTGSVLLKSKSSESKSSESKSSESKSPQSPGG